MSGVDPESGGVRPVAGRLQELIPAPSSDGGCARSAALHFLRELSMDDPQITA